MMDANTIDNEAAAAVASSASSTRANNKPNAWER